MGLSWVWGVNLGHGSVRKKVVPARGTGPGFQRSLERWSPRLVIAWEPKRLPGGRAIYKD